MRLLRHVVLLLLLFPAGAFADSTGWFFGNTGGTMTFDPTTGTLTLTSTITKIIFDTRTGAHITETGNFGTITLTSGPLISGSLLHEAFFNGGSITLTVANTGLMPFTLSGTLNTLTWWVDKSGDHFGGSGVGLINGVIGTPIYDFSQLAVLSGPNQYSIIQGRTVIPEPGTMVLVVTGLGLIAGRAKLRGRAVH